MPTITTVDAAWTSGITMDEGELRRAETTSFLGDGSNNGVRGGIVRHGDNSLAVAVNGSDQITVQSGAFVIPGATGLGVYRGSLPATTSAVGITARNATNPRIDLIVIQIVSGQAQVRTVDGTASSSPTAPAMPANAIEIARLNVPRVANGAVVVDTSWRTYATGLGGDLYVESAARLPGSGNQKGQRAIALDTGAEHRWTGTTWRAEGVTSDFTPTLTAVTTNPTLGTGAITTGRWVERDGWVTYQYRIRFGTSGVAAGSGTYLISLPVPPSTAWANRSVGTGVISDASSGGMSPVWLTVNGTASQIVMLFPASWPSGTAASVNHLNTVTWAASDEMTGTVTYERA